jgi:4-hydroxy-tetrahydrodipicolinate synthase
LESRVKISGLVPATVTPFKADWSINEADLKNHVRRVAKVDGVFGVVVNAHAGEILALTSDERRRIIEVSKDALPKDKKLIAGVDGRTIGELVGEGLGAKRAGADFLLVLPPYDTRLYRYLSRYKDNVHYLFAELSRQVNLPMIVFLYPETSGCAYPVDVLKTLRDIPNVVAIKATTGNVIRYSQVWNELKNDFSILPSCDSPELLGMLLCGAHGSLLGISTVGTEIWSELVRRALSSDAEGARQIFNKNCLPLMDALFENQEQKTEIGWVGSVKEALIQLGELSSPYVRWPLVPPDKAKKEHVARALISSGLLKGAEAASLTTARICD